MDGMINEIRGSRGVAVGPFNLGFNILLLLFYFHALEVGNRYNGLLSFYQILVGNR